MAGEARCRLCGGTATWAFRQRLLANEVDYFACPVCELIETEEPYWLAEAYTAAISQLDTGAIERNQTCARLTAVLARVLEITPEMPCLDYGGGHGVFVRLMRDRGFDFACFDTHADNVYARGFDGDPATHHAVVTAFEVFEHFADVAADIARVFVGSPDFVLVGTELHAGHRPGWWYYLPDTGQHVAFYSRATLEWIARAYGYTVEAGTSYALFSRARLSPIRRALVRQILRHPTAATEVAAVVEPMARRIGRLRSRSQADHDTLRTRSR
jgi:hypothetical protein